MIAVDWYGDTDRERTAELRIGDIRHEVLLKFGTMIKCCVKGSYAAYAHDECAEVLSVSDDGIATVQGSARVTFTLVSRDRSRTVTVDFSDAGVKTIKI